jgi:hypothetical protein
LSGSFPTYEDEILTALSAILTRVCGSTLVFDGPPQYEVPDAAYPIGIIDFVETFFHRLGGGGVLKAGHDQEQVYNIQVWCIRKKVASEDLWRNIRQKGAAIKVAIEADYTLGGKVTFAEVSAYATDNEVTERMSDTPSDTCGVRVDLRIICEVGNL